MGAQRATWLLSLAVMIGVASAAAGSMVTEFWFNNKCDYDVELLDWATTIPAGTNKNISWQRPAGLDQRISWRPKGGKSYDFIELNGAWTGQGASTGKGHWSYSTYNGFNMGSMFEALNPSGNGYACSDPGVKVDFGSALDPMLAPIKGVCQTGDGYSCKGGTQCGTAISNFIMNNSWMILGNGTLERTNNGIAGNYWCAESGGFPPSWLKGGVGALIDCIDHGKPFMLRVTTCPRAQKEVEFLHV